MKNKQNILDQAVKEFSEGTIPAGPSDDLVRQTLDRIEKQQSTIPFMERIGKMKSISKFAAAAVILIGVSMLFLFNNNPGSVALADVYAKVQQAQAFMYKMSMTMSGMGDMMGIEEMNGTMEMDMTVVISEEYGMKMENRMTVPGPKGKTQKMTQLAYLLPEDNVMISIMPEQKMYQRIEFTDDLLEQTKKQNNDPREMIKQMLGSEYVDLGFLEIDGTKVQGFETTDPEYMMGVAEEVKATLWVDVETWMPVKSEIWAKIAGMESTYVIDQFQWDVPVSASDFECVIPEDYEEQGSMKMPEMTEESAVEGLRLYKNLFGQYPEKIDVASLVPSLMKNIVEMSKNPQTEFAKEFAEKMKVAEAAGDKAVAQQAQQEFVPITSLSMFHMMLLQEKKDVAYFGDQVTPEDTDAVLMRWKVEGDTYKVIFGDLSTAEMEYEDLIKIEPKPLPESPQTEAIAP